uniref:Uncharacterized protein n=1 Tax=Arion vulgaris TaxID=1028688 RepID=A0A0B7BK91_9EUPU
MYHTDWHRRSCISMDSNKLPNSTLQQCNIKTVQYNFLLMVQLTELNNNPFLINWIFVAVFKRKVVFKFGSWASSPTTIHPGLPQWSLFSVTVQSLYCENHKRTDQGEDNVICR